MTWGGGNNKNYPVVLMFWECQKCQTPVPAFTKDFGILGAAVMCINTKGGCDLRYLLPDSLMLWQMTRWLITLTALIIDNPPLSVNQCPVRPDWAATLDWGRDVKADHNNCTPSHFYCPWVKIITNKFAFPIDSCKVLNDFVSFVVVCWLHRLFNALINMNQKHWN